MGTETNLQQQFTMPARWKNVHDCERPLRWREQLDEEDCKVRLQQLRSGAAADDGQAELRRTWGNPNPIRNPNPHLHLN